MIATVTSLTGPARVLCLTCPAPTTTVVLESSTNPASFVSPVSPVPLDLIIAR